jgi:23S rRNA maturation-related 3'-5' exoribonuclease YhaM
MADNNANKISWTEHFRIITPFLLLVLSVIGGSINARLSDIDNKLFKHLTNDELHCPRSMVVSKAEYTIYQTMRDRQMIDIKEQLSRIECNIDKRYAKP